MKFKKTLLIISIIICIFTMASVCAGDADETTIASDNTQTELLENSEMEKNLSIICNDEENNSTLTEQINIDENPEPHLDYANLTPQTHIVNNSNIDEIFNGENHTLGDNINEGDTLDFNGTIDKNHLLVINKPVNIISSSKNGVINLHTITSDYENNIPKNSFIINAGASGSNISDLYINNTQTWIYNVHDICLKNMIMHVSSINIGAGAGQVSIRYCNRVTLDNCRIFTNNNGESICFALVGTSDSTLVNSTIEGQGSVGTLIYLGLDQNTEDAPENYTITATNNTIKDCIIKTGSPNAFPIADDGDHTTIDGVKVYASKNIKPGVYSTVMNNILYNASGIDLNPYSVAYNNTVYGSGSQIQKGTNVYNNTFKDVKITAANVTFTNNTVRNLLTIFQPTNLHNNDLNSITLNQNSKYSNITDNTLKGTITVNVVNVTIKSNFMNTTNEYCVLIKADGAVITNNVMYASTKFGNNAVSSTRNSTVIEDNTPQPSFKLLSYLIQISEGTIVLGQDYHYDCDIDYELMSGIFINKDLTIIGNGYSLNGEDQSRILQISHATVTIQNVTFINGKGQIERYKGNDHEVGGAITAAMGAKLTVIKSDFTNNHADQDGWGAAIFVTGNSTLTINKSTFTDNNASSDTVIFLLDGESASIIDCNLNMDDIGNDKGDMGLVAPIKIFTVPNLIFNISDSVEGSNATISITEPEGFNGRINLTTNTNQTIANIQFDHGQASIQLNLASGIYTATIINDYTEYNKDISKNIACIYTPAIATSNEFAVYKQVDVILDVQDITYGENQTIKATIDAPGNVTIKLNGEIIAEEIIINDSEIEYAISKTLIPGNYTVEVIYNGNNLTLPNSNITHFTVNKIDSTLSVGDLAFDYNTTGSTAINFSNANGVSANVINQPEANVTIEDNVIYVSGLNAGNYTLSVTTLVDDYHNNVTKTASITVNKINSTLTVNNLIFNYGSTGSTTSSFTGAAGITASVVNQPKAIVTVNGNAIQVSGLNAGSYSLKVTTITDSNHNAVTKTAKITVNKLETKLTASDITTTYNIDKNLAIKLSSQGKPLSNVKLTIKLSNGKTLTKTTDKYGQVIVSTNGLVPKTYTAKITFAENSNYKASSKSANIKVNKANPKLTAANKAFKVKAVKKVTAILKDNKNRVLKNKLVSFKVNGITYKVKTNSKGVATATVKITKTGTFSTVVSFAGDNCYNKISKTIRAMLKS